MCVVCMQRVSVFYTHHAGLVKVVDVHIHFHQNLDICMIFSQGVFTSGHYYSFVRGNRGRQTQEGEHDTW